MSLPKLPDQETTINGPRTRRWTLEARECPELSVHRISRLGIDAAYEPYCRVRLQPSGSFIFACLEGEGRVLLEGRWQRVTAGSLCMAPPRVLNALQAIPGKPWVVAWLRYEEPPFVKPVVGADSPLILRRSADDLGRVISGLRAEWESERSPALIHHWICLLQGLASRLTRPWKSSSRVRDLWETVAADIATDWTLQSLAGRCHLSSEHLRRICRSELGRTPMEHVTYMRMQRARELLESGDAKLETIAAELGYRSATVFSRAFARCVGMLPSQYRGRR